jgi:hypothetical protein
MNTTRWRLCFCLGLAACVIVAAAGEADAERRSQRYRKLDTSERVRAIERARGAAFPELSRRAARAVGASFRSEVLLVERHRYAKGEDTTRRLADIYIYDYEQDELCRVVVDLDTDAIESLHVGEGVQLPLTPAEVSRATRLALDDPEFGTQLRSDYQRIMGKPLASPEDLDVSAFAYRADSMADGARRESRVCGKRRCAQILVTTPDGVVLDLPIVDLSRDRLLDSREFGLNGRERLRRRRAAEDAAGSNPMGAPGSPGADHSDHGHGSGHAH